MSGKISTNGGFVGKADFLRLQSKVDSLITQLSETRQEIKSALPSPTSPSVQCNRKLSGGVKAWLYAKAGSSTPKSASNVNSTCQNCGNEQGSNTNRQIFHRRGLDEDLDNQRCSKNEFNRFQVEVTMDIKQLQKSVQDIEAFCDNLEKSVHESLSYLQTTIDKMDTQISAAIQRIDQLTLQNNATYLGNFEAVKVMKSRNMTDI